MPSLSLFLRSSATLVSVLSLLSGVARGVLALNYVLDTQYSGSTFFNGFDFFTSADPTHGFVTYVDQNTAQSSGLISAGTTVYIGVDYTNTYNGSANYYNINGVGRPSVRLTSQKAWTHGLFLADIAHMPGGICGTWPAFWTLGPNWPYNGEIDIIEGTNNINYDVSTAHTGSNCTIAATAGTFTGALQGTDCYEDNEANTAGCSFDDQSTNSYGTGFNSNNGGVYAMEWTSDYIQIWFFPRGSIPSDITSGSPKPTTWGTPDAIFNGPNCNIDTNFASHNIVIDNTFCGDWAGATWSNSGGCASATGQSSCSVHVGSNPSAFKNAYWTFNSIQVFQAQSSSSTMTTTTTTTTTTTSALTTLSTSTTTTTTTSANSSSSPTTTSSTSVTPITTSSSKTTTTSSSKTTTKATTTSSKTTTKSTTTKSTTTSSRRFPPRALPTTDAENVDSTVTRHMHARKHVHGHAYGQF